MISVQEVAESYARRTASIGDVETIKQCLIDALVSLGASPFAEWDFGGPRHKKVYSDDDVVEQLAEKYLGGHASVRDADTIMEGIVLGLKKIGQYRPFWWT